MWGYRPGNYNGTNLTVWGEGEPIITSEGDEVGAFNASNIYLYWDANEAGSEEEFNIFGKVFDAVVAGLTADDTARQLAVRERYITACTGRMKARESELSTKIASLQTEVRGFQDAIVERIRIARTIEFELSGIARGVDEVQAQLAAEFDRIVKMPKVRSVGWRGTNFTINTDVLYCTDPRTKVVHEIGAFKLVFDMRLSEVLFFNETRKLNAYRNGMNGPHLFPDGRACLGNMQNILPKLIGGYEWAQAVVMALTFIESVNVEDAAGKFISMWPIHKPTPVVTAPAATPVAVPATV
jgi:hypothetical protein